MKFLETQRGTTFSILSVQTINKTYKHINTQKFKKLFLNLGEPKNRKERIKYLISTGYTKN